jgi:hypothetical protein
MIWTSPTYGLTMMQRTLFGHPLHMDLDSICRVRDDHVMQIKFAHSGFLFYIAALISI